MAIWADDVTPLDRAIRFMRSENNRLEALAVGLAKAHRELLGSARDFEAMADERDQYGHLKARVGLAHETIRNSERIDAMDYVAALLSKAAKSQEVES